MPQRTISMRKMKDILRLHAAGLRIRQIARSLNLSKSVVHKYVRQAHAIGLSWPLPTPFDDKTLKATLACPSKESSKRTYHEPDGAQIHQELKRKGMTLKLLHQEYKEQYPETHYKYTGFCALYNRWKDQQDLSLRQVYKAGDILFIDYAGQKAPITNPVTGEIQEASLFIAALGASNYVYAEATWDQTLPHWISSHVRAFAYFGGVPALLVPDNLKTGVSRACYYEPDANPTYADMVAHYDTAVMPARPYQPRDKGKVESAVQVAERWILARLRHCLFYSLEALNEAIKGLLEELNKTPFQKLPGSRLSQFEMLDQPALKPLPERPYEYAEFKRRRVGKDYHIEVNKHYYSVPYSYARQEVDLRMTAHVIEVFANGERIASHERKRTPGTTTLREHMPEAHRKHCEWTLDIALAWALRVGPSTHALLAAWSAEKRHPHQQYRLFLGLAKLARRFGEQRLENACQRALIYGLASYLRLQTLLEKGLDRNPLPAEKTDDVSPIHHHNIRGPHYYEGIGQC
jgi:transposase